MATRKRNEWLDGDEDEEDYGSNTSDIEETKGSALTGRNTTRRKIDSEVESADESEDDDFDTRLDKIKPIPADGTTARVEQGDNPDTTPHAAPKSKTSRTILKPLTSKQLAASPKAVSKTGVIYISRVPPS